jgi:hypothetical protein
MQDVNDEALHPSGGENDIVFNTGEGNLIQTLPIMDASNLIISTLAGAGCEHAHTI